MKVLFIVRSTLYTVKGGDTIQVMETAAHLRELGVEVDIQLANARVSYSPYMLLHFFNLARPADILMHMYNSGKPFVISPIMIDYSTYDKQYRRGFAGKLFQYLPAARIEYLKTLYRCIRRKDSLVSASYLWKGQAKSIGEILKKTAAVFVSADEEYTALVKVYNIEPPKVLIQNGINSLRFIKDGTIKRQDDLVICIARIEGIKNQYNLIKALNDTKYTLLLIGDAAPNQPNYYLRCKSIAAANIVFINYLPQEELQQYYAAAKVHVLPSWFEVCGLSSLEAAAMGCNVVITDKGYAATYFNDAAYYCDPGDPVSILSAVEAAAANSTNQALETKVRSEYSWQLAAEKILSAYENIIV